MSAMLPDGRRLGAHLPLGRGMIRAAERAAAIGADTFQIFTDNPTAWRRRAAPPAELPAVAARIEALGLVPLVVHASYLINLAGPPGEAWDASVELLAGELRVAPTFGASIVNVHCGSHLGAGTEDGLARLGEGIARAVGLAAPEGALRLVLELSSGSGTGVGTVPAEIATAIDAAEAGGVEPDRLGVCLDTAHAWGAGHDVGTIEGVDRLVADLDRTIGLRRVRLVHLNDSRSERGSRTDHHEHLGAGRIGVAGLRRVLTHPDLAGVTYILETPGMDDGYDAIDLERARAIAAGAVLEPLPAPPPEPAGGRRRRTAAHPEPERVA